MRKKTIGRVTAKARKQAGEFCKAAAWIIEQTQRFLTYSKRQDGLIDMFFDKIRCWTLSARAARRNRRPLGRARRGGGTGGERGRGRPRP